MYFYSSKGDDFSIRHAPARMRERNHTLTDIRASAQFVDCVKRQVPVLLIVSGKVVSLHSLEGVIPVAECRALKRVLWVPAGTYILALSTIIIRDGEFWIGNRRVAWLEDGRFKVNTTNAGYHFTKIRSLITDYLKGVF